MGFNDLTALIEENELCKADAGMAALQAVGSMEYRNYLFTAPNGAKLLIWGNEPTVEQVNICKALQPDIAILQRSTTQESIVKTADFAAEIGCKVLIPHHHNFKNTEDPEIIKSFGKAFLDRVPDGTFISPDHGEWIHL